MTHSDLKRFIRIAAQTLGFVATVAAIWVFVWVLVPSEEESARADAKYEREYHPGMSKEEAEEAATLAIAERFGGTSPHFRMVRSRLGKYIARDAWVVTLRNSRSKKLWCVWAWDANRDDPEAVVGHC